MGAWSPPGMQPAGGSGAFLETPVSFPSPHQRPPTTSASSSGTLGHPTRTTNSRPGDAARQDSPGWGVGAPESAASCPPASHLLAATCSHWIPPPPPCASALFPPARTPTCWPAVRAAAAAGTCGWTSPRRRGEHGQGMPRKPVLRAEQLQVQGSDPRHTCRVVPALCPSPWGAQRQFPGPYLQSWGVRTSCSSLEERSLSSTPGCDHLITAQVLPLASCGTFPCPA